MFQIGGKGRASVIAQLRWGKTECKRATAVQAGIESRKQGKKPSWTWVHIKECIRDYSTTNHATLISTLNGTCVTPILIAAHSLTCGAAQQNAPRLGSKRFKVRNMRQAVLRTSQTSKLAHAARLSSPRPAPPRASDVLP